MDGDPEVNEQDEIGGLTLASQLAGFLELDQLDRFFEEAEAWGERALVALRPAGSTDWYASPAFILESLVYIGSDLSREQLAKTEAGDFYVDGILQARAAIPLP